MFSDPSRSARPRRLWEPGRPAPLDADCFGVWVSEPLRLSPGLSSQERCPRGADLQVAEPSGAQPGRGGGKLRPAPRRTRPLRPCLGKDASASYH